MIQKAAEFAAHVHAGALRKGSKLPYIVHPREVAMIVAMMTEDPEVIAAAYLHDVIEDAGVRYEELEEQFGKRVADLVQAESENKLLTWQERKQATIDRMKHAPEDMKMIAFGDKLSNLRSTATDYLIIGEELWKKFHEKDKRMHAWYYGSMAEAFQEFDRFPFYEEDHIELSKMIMALHERGCYVILTNSNHPLVHELYAPFNIDVIQTKRHISCNGSTRKGEDVIVTIPPKQRTLIKLLPQPLPEQVSAYPPTRFMGSKSKLLSEIWSVASQFKVNTVVDLFSGSGIVGYMFKAQGKSVVSNDYMAMSATFTKAMIENNSVTLPLDKAKGLLIEHRESDHFVASTFKGLYYTDEENDLIDTLRTNIADIKDQYKHAIAMTALIRACIKKRPRGIFTYTGQRYNDGRKDLQKTLAQQFLEAVEAVNKAVFDNGQINRSKQGDAMDLRVEQVDLVYIDPPYYSPLSDNEYVRRYHFVEGLARDWKGVEIQQHTQTKKFKSYPTPFATRKGAADAFDHLFKKFANSILIVSYSSNSLPTQDEMVAIMAKYKQHVEVIPVDYKYSFGNQSDAKTHRNSVQEYLFVGY